MSVDRITQLMEQNNGISTTTIPAIKTNTDDIPLIENILAGAQETLTGFITEISSDHNYIHQGKGYSVPFSSAGLAAGSDYKIGFQTPTVVSGKMLHWRPALVSSSANVAQFKLYEASLFSGGTPIQPINRDRLSTNHALTTFYAGTTAALTGIVAVNANAGGNFANQPAGSKITVVSDNNVEDKLISLIAYGTITGSTTVVTTETIDLDGTTPVDSVATTWQNMLGFELSGAATGTVTIKDGSGNTIITIAPAGTAAGIATVLVTNAREQIVRHDASDTTTAPVGIIGTKPDGTALTSVDTLNNTTEENHNSDIFSTVTKVLIGAVASTRNVTILYPEKLLTQFTVGSGGTSNRMGGSNGSDLEFILSPDTKYVIYLKNSGSVTATDIEGEAFYYEE